ncbi:hypothetical protein D3C75_748380 [compost metagenome]
MGELKQVQGQHLQEGFDPSPHGGDHPGAEQQSTRREGAHAHQGGHELPGRHHHPLQPVQAGPLLQQLLPCEQQEGTEEGQEVVGAAVDQQGGEQLVHRQIVGEQQAHARLENPDAPRHMGQHPEQAGEHEGTEQHRIGHAARWQQHIEHGGGGHPVEQGDKQLQQAVSDARQEQ